MDEISEDEYQKIATFYLSSNVAYTAQQKPAWLQFYRDLTVQGSSEYTYMPIEPLIQTHQRLRDLVQCLRTRPWTTRKELEEALCQGAVAITYDQKLYAIRRIVWLGFMLDCTIKDHVPRRLFSGKYKPVRWKPDQQFADFVEKSLAARTEGIEEPYEDRSKLKAWKIAKRCRLRIEKTDNITEHLLYDREAKVLKIYHQMAYLRNQLHRFSCPIEAVTLNESLEKGSLPPQLILETLDSFYGILFPIAEDEKDHSSKLLTKLVQEQGFDPGCFTEAHSKWFPRDEDFKYHYWADRLQELSDLAANPPPTSMLWSWMERHTASERSALGIAILGLFLSAFFGLLGCVVGIAQLYVAILAWKYPVSSS